MEFDARVHEITAVSFPVLSPQPPGMYVAPGGCLQVVCARGLHRVAPAPLEGRTQKSTPGPPLLVFAPGPQSRASLPFWPRRV